MKGLSFNIVCVTPVVCVFFPLIPVEIAIRAVEEDRLESVASADSLALGKVLFLLFSRSKVSCTTFKDIFF